MAVLNPPAPLGVQRFHMGFWLYTDIQVFYFCVPDGMEEAKFPFNQMGYLTPRS